MKRMRGPKTAFKFIKAWRHHIVGLAQEKLNSIANALDLGLSCTNPSIRCQNQGSWSGDTQPSPEPMLTCVSWIPKKTFKWNCDQNMMVSFKNIPDSKVHGTNMGPTWVLSARDGPHVGPMNLAIEDAFKYHIMVDILCRPQCVNHICFSFVTGEILSDLQIDQQ